MIIIFHNPMWFYVKQKKHPVRTFLLLTGLAFLAFSAGALYGQGNLSSSVTLRPAAGMNQGVRMSDTKAKVDTPLATSPQSDDGQMVQPALVDKGDDDKDTVPNDQDVCPGTQPDAMKRLSGNYFAWDKGQYFMTGKSGQYWDALRLSLEQTRGCSCKQILQELKGTEWEKNYGCSLGTMVRWMKHLEGLVTIATE